MDQLIVSYAALWSNYANFRDRTSVGGYWWAFLANLIVSLVLGLVLGIIDGLTGIPLRWIVSLYSIAIFIPSLAIVVRRLRDAGKKWYYMLIALVPLVGEILLIVWLCGPTVSSEGQQV